MHYLCQICQKSFSQEQLFKISKQISGDFRLLNVCPDCKKKHEEDLERTRQNFQAQFGEKAVEKKADVDVYKIIDDAMEKKDRSVVLYIGEHGTSVYVNPYKDDKVVWKGTPGAKRPYCSNCGREAEGAYPYCPWCGEQVAISEEDAKAINERNAKRKRVTNEERAALLKKIADKEKENDSNND